MVIEFDPQRRNRSRGTASEVVNLGRVQGGGHIQTGDIVPYFEDLNLTPNAEIGQEALLLEKKIRYLPWGLITDLVSSALLLP
jgi:hypothetical protein